MGTVFYRFLRSSRQRARQACPTPSRGARRTGRAPGEPPERQLQRRFPGPRQPGGRPEARRAGLRRGTLLNRGPWAGPAQVWVRRAGLQALPGRSAKARPAGGGVPLRAERRPAPKGGWSPPGDPGTRPIPSGSCTGPCEAGQRVYLKSVPAWEEPPLLSLYPVELYPFGKNLAR